MIKKDNFGTRSNSKLAASGPIKAGTTNANLGGKSVVARSNTPAQDPNLGRLVLTTIIQDIPKYSIDGEGNQVAINYTSLQIPKEKELRHPLVAGIQVSLVSGNFSQLITITSTLALNDTTISVASFNPNVDIGKGALICIDEEDLFNQYQNKTKGTIAGFTVDSDGIAKSGIEITDWLNSDTMTGASVNNVPTALSVKNYVDNSHPAEDQTLQEVTDNGNTTTNDIILSNNNVLRSSNSNRFVQIQDGSSQMIFSSYGAHIHKTYDNVSYAERMRLSRFGDLSIGTTTGGYKLLVSGTGWEGEGIAINSTTTAGAVLTLKTTQRQYQIASRGDSFEIRDITAGDITRIDINSTGRTTFGNTTNAGPLKVYYSDGSYINYTGYGIELNRDYSYIRPTATNDKRLFIGNQTLSWFELELNSTTTLFKNGTAEFMRITSAGLVGIGTSSPTRLLHVEGAVAYSTGGWAVGTTATQVGKLFNESGVMTLRADSSRQIALGNVSGGEAMRIDAAGNVGIGTSSPEEKMSVSGSIQLTNQQELTWADIGDGNTGRVAIRGNEDADWIMFKTDNSERMRLTNTGLGIGTTSPIGTKLHVVSGSTDLVARFISSDNKASIQISDNDTTGYISAENNVISIGSVLGAHANNLNIKSNNIGIGTTSPNRLLTLSASGGTYQAFNSTSNNNTTIGSDGTGAFIVYDDTASSYRMVVKATTGNVGIGTTSPASIMHIYGTTGIVSESPSNASITIRRNDNTNYSALLKYHTGNSEKWVAGLSDAGDFTGSTGVEYFIGKTKTDPKFLISSSGNVLIGTTTDSGNKLEVNGVASATTFAGDLRGTINTLTTGVTQTANDNSTKIATTAYVDSAEAGTSSFGSFTPASTQSIASGGNVGVKSTLLLATSQVTASNITTSSAGLTFANAGLYQISFNFASKVSGTANRTLAAANLEYSTDGETWTEIVGSLVYNYDRGTATSGGASSWGFVYDGSASCSFIHNLATSSKIRARFWIEGRASSASGITTIINGCRLSAHKIG